MFILFIKYIVTISITGSKAFFIDSREPMSATVKKRVKIACFLCELNPDGAEIFSVTR